MKTFWSLLGMMMLVTGPAGAGEDSIYDTPTAPKQYLAMKNLYSPADFDQEALARITEQYNELCGIKCHGKNGDSKGTDTPKMPLKPVAFSKPGYLEGKKDGQLFWIIQKGSKDTEMKAFGEESEANLTDEEIWELVTYLRMKFTTK